MGSFDLAGRGLAATLAKGLGVFEAGGVVVAWRQRGLFFSGVVACPVPISWVVELQFFVLTICVEEPWLGRFGGRSFLKTVDFVHRPQRQLVELFALAVVLRLDDLQPIGLLILVRMVKIWRYSNQILLIFVNGRYISTAIHLEEQRYVHLLFALRDLVLRIVGPNDAQICDLADHVFQVLGQPLQINGGGVGLALQKFDHALIIQLFLDLIFNIFSNLLIA